MLRGRDRGCGRSVAFSYPSKARSTACLPWASGPVSGDSGECAIEFEPRRIATKLKLISSWFRCFVPRSFWRKGGRMKRWLKWQKSLLPGVNPGVRYMGHLE